jgi:hypothetical protein
MVHRLLLRVRLLAMAPSGKPRHGSETGTGGPVIRAECPYCHRRISLYKRKAHPNRRYRATAGLFFFMHNIAPYVRCLGSKSEYTEGS